MQSKYNCRTIVFTAGLALAVLGSACARSGAPAIATGTARLVTTCWAPGCADIARVTVTVSAGDGPAFTPIVADLSFNGTEWSGRISQVPAGPGRLFTVVAADSSGKPLFTGSGKTDIVAGATATISIQLQGPEPPPVGNAFPVIDSLAWSRDQVLPGSSVQLIVSAHDPNAGDTISYLWSATCGVFDDATKSAPLWTAPSTEQLCQISITVTDNHGAAVTASFIITVTTNLGDAIVNASVNAAPVITSLSGSVKLGPTMEGDLALVASDPDGDQLNYAWTSTCNGLTFNLQSPYSVTDPHFTFPGPSDPCTITVTVSDDHGSPGTQATITLPPNQSLIGKCTNVTCLSGQTCDPTTGLCIASANLCANVRCTALDPCHLAGVCDPATGTCSNPAAPDGTACDDGNACTQTDTCQAGVCTGSSPVVCSGTDTCDPATGQCSGTSTTLVPRPQVAKDLALSPLAGLAMDVNGAAYVAGSIFQPTKTFDGIPVNSAGGADVFLAKYDPVTHSAVWAKNYGDAADQLAAGAAVTADGTVAAIGNFIGNMSFGTSTISNASQSPIDFLAAVNATNGSGKWAKSFNDGLGGVLLAVAANPTLNLIAVCGYANQAATDLVPGQTTYGGGNRDIVIGVFNSAGAPQWSHQFGGANEEECDSLAIDDNGDVYAAGKYDGALSFTASSTICQATNGVLPNPFPATCLPNPNSSFRRWLWLAKFDATGAAVSQASFGSGAGIHTPKSIAVDSAGKLVVGGSFTATLPFGTTSLVSAGNGSDAFVAKLDPAAATPFAPVWAVRMGSTGGDEVHGVAVSSSTDVVATGLFNTPTSAATTGAAALNAASTAAANAFVLKLDGSTGATQFSAAYGDVYTTSGDAVAVNRYGTGSAKDLVDFAGGYGGTITFPAPAGSLTTTNTDAFLVFALFQP